jgi:hypothetical protein
MWRRNIVNRRIQHHDRTMNYTWLIWSLVCRQSELLAVLTLDEPSEIHED